MDGATPLNAGLPQGSGSGTSGVSGNVSNAINAMKETINKNPSYIIGIVFIIFLILFVGIYIYLKIRSGADFFTMLAKPTLLNKVNLSVGNDTDMPKAVSDYTYSFWLYVKDIGQNNLKRRIFIRGDNPIVYMDEGSNSLHFRLKTTFGKKCTNAIVKSINKDYNAGATATANASNTFTNDITGAYIDLKVDYIPMNRWCHLVMTVDSQNVILYMDGDVYKVMPAFFSISSLCPGGTGTPTNETAGLDISTGNAFIGPEDTSSPSVDGYLSRLYFFNYALSLDKVRKLYESGPTSEGLLSMLGITSYGVRNPIYRTDSAPAE